MQKKVVMEIGASEEERGVIRNVLQAVQQKKRVEFSYTDALSHESFRKVEPLHLLWEKGVWYVECYCLQRLSMRTFRVSRMKNLELLEETFVPSTVALKHVYEENEEIHALLRFDASAKQRVSEQFQEEWTQDGENIIVDTLFYTWGYAIAVVLSYGAVVEVVHPKELREKVMQEVVAVQQIYMKE
ncbi:WYL domain-containing protein [Bacillus sp. JCM 19041]|uniref:WYL domain-containing protein n=1 Tax=Bacillus sp. JCM 19041 TaxID=1460637 RepID=UPI003369D139